MAPKTTSRGSASKSAPKETKGSRATRGGGAHTVHYAEEEDEIDVEEGYGAAGGDRRGGDDDEDEDEDPVSTAELQKVIKAFSKGKASKEKANAGKVASQCKELLAATETSTKANIKQQLAKCDQFIIGLNLEDSISLGGHDSAHYAAMLEKQKAEAEEQLTIFDEIIEEMDPANNLFYEEVRQHLADRPALGKRCHKKLRSAVQKELAEQTEMAELYAQAAPKIAKGFRIAMGA